MTESSASISEFKEHPTFSSGVVEGFYGKPWTNLQRVDLFNKLHKWGMNSYVYAPKDDYKHRAFWRDLYTKEESEQISSLITEAHNNNINFYYAISPGLDITYSDPKEIGILKKKLDQIQGLGCKSFALLFDDIETDLKDEDLKVYDTFAQAHVAISNEIYHHLCQPNFMFCPTEYCSSRALPNVKESEYLNTVGNVLHPSIDVLWTGPLVISRRITIDHIKEVGSVLKRPPVIWENLHANDYDRARLYLGPFSDRLTDIIPHLKGFLTNPNCEYGPNFVAINTLGQWVQNSQHVSDKATNDQTVHPYDPREALYKALKEWLPEFNFPVDAFGSVKPEIAANSSASSAKASDPKNDDEELTYEDLLILADLFYLPFEDGKHSLAFISEFKWLKDNIASVILTDISNGDKVTNYLMDEWHTRAEAFGEMTASVKKMAEKIDYIKNRSLLYEIYPYVSTAKGVVGILNSYIEWIRSAKYLKQPFKSEYRQMDLWLKRGGVPAELHRMLLDSLKEFSYLENMSCANPDGVLAGASSHCHLIRPYQEGDRERIYNLISRLENDSQNSDLFRKHPNLKGQLSIGTFIERDLKDQTLMVIEDEFEKLCAFCLCISNASEGYKHQKSYFEEFKQQNAQMTASEHSEFQILLSKEHQVPPESLLCRFPSLMLLNAQPQLKRPVIKRLFSYALNFLKRSGSGGIHVRIKKDSKDLCDMYSDLGFDKAQDLDNYIFMTLHL